MVEKYIKRIIGKDVGTDVLRGAIGQFRDDFYKSHRITKYKGYNLVYDTREKTMGIWQPGKDIGVVYDKKYGNLLSVAHDRTNYKLALSEAKLNVNKHYTG